MTESLLDLVRSEWLPRLMSHGFHPTVEEQHHVVLDSPVLRLVASHDPRGEVDVKVFPHGREPWEGWSYSGMIGTASLGRVLEMALEGMDVEPAMLRGDAGFYEALAVEARAHVQEWIAHQSGHGPGPGRPHLP